MRLRTLVYSIAFTLACLMLVPTARAAWPEHPIKIIVPFSAGGQLDVVVRLIGDKIGPALGQPIIVEIRTGADGNIGAEAVARSAPDGYTWLATSVPFTTQTSLQPGKLRYDPLRDFRPVAMLGTASFVLVVPNSVPVSTLKDFIAYAKTRPGQLSYAGTSVGSVTHLSTEMFLRATGLRMEMIPYAGIPAAMSDLLSGRTQFMSTGVIAALPQIKAGKLKPLAILAAERHPQLPDVPTIVEEGHPELIVATWFGLLVPASTPNDIVQTINTEVMKALRDPDVLAKYRSMGVEPVAPHAPEVFGALLKTEVERWGKVIHESNITVQ
ncbi:MAG TPA: tripartite tricarboxylate transporter substrate binding protein [Casimicrobiaceae bacterium]|jgi:tripartite-type tricarboxylate transporter receptor subunit TctC